MLVGLGVFAGSASALGTTVYDYDMYLAWWDSFDCDEMKVILPRKTGATPAESASAHTGRVLRIRNGERKEPEPELDSTMATPAIDRVVAEHVQADGGNRRRVD